MIDEDPVEIVRRANPVPLETLPDPSGSRRAQLVYDSIVSAPARPRQVAALRRRVAVAIFGATAAVSAGAVAYALVAGNVTKTATVACYGSADLNAKTIVVPAGEEEPRRACAALWAAGSFGSRSVPALSSCVLDSGVVAVFPVEPGTNPCERLDLPEPVVEPATPGSRDFAAFKDDVVTEFLERRCVDAAEARAIVRRRLDQHGLGDWTVQTAGGNEAGSFAPPRSCASLAFDETERRVILVPAPPAP